MSEDIISAKDFQIKNLQNQIMDLEKEKDSLLKRLDNVVYFSIVSIDMFEKSRKKVLSAARGEIERSPMKAEEGVKDG